MNGGKMKFFQHSTVMAEISAKRIVLGITGGIAAYKSAELVRLLVQAGTHVDVVLTEAAAHFVGAATFQALSGHPVWLWSDLWHGRPDNGMAHIDLSRVADAILVAPASADFLAKLAQGRADDLLSTLCLARTCPLLVAPAMNLQMWQNPATQRNVAQLAADGVFRLGPDAGEQACGETGAGRMLEAEALFDELTAFFQPKLLAGRRALITAGPTFEAIDPVRGVTNASSGRMGFALARACAEAGAAVTLVAGPVSLVTPRAVTRIDVTSALDMRAAVFAQLAGCDLFIGVAAVADYRPEQRAADKIKKSQGPLTLNMVPNPDILAEVAALRKAPFCVGFAAESGNLDEYADGKRRAKNLPLVVGNLIADGLGGDTNRVTLFDAAGCHPLPQADKLTVARTIVAHIAALMLAP